MLSQWCSGNYFLLWTLTIWELAGTVYNQWCGGSWATGTIAPMEFTPANFGGSNYDSLFVRTVAFPVQVAYWTKEVIAPCGYSVPCQFWPVVRRHGRGVLWAGSDPCMTGRLEYPLAWPVLAQRWSQTATDGPGTRLRHSWAAVTDHKVYVF